ncbi:MAG: hypothetical protein RLZZ436_446, partial [Planctomycetota bacterium]
MRFCGGTQNPLSVTDVPQPTGIRPGKTPIGSGREDTPAFRETTPFAFPGHLASGGPPGFRWTNRTSTGTASPQVSFGRAGPAQMELRPPHSPDGRKKTAAGTYCKSLRLFKLHSNGLEPLTFGSVDRCSIQLSYECVRGSTRAGAGGLPRG